MESLRRLKSLVQAQLSISPSLRLSGSKRYRTVADTKAFLKSAISGREIMRDMALDLGSGSQPKNPFEASTIYGIDIVSHDNQRLIQCDLFRDRIPFEDNSISVVTAFDFLEHVPRVHIAERSTRFPFVQLVGEIHRVLRPGGLFLQSSPAFPMKEAFQDPTHVNIITEETFPQYFCSNGPSAPWGSIYGFTGAFTLLSQAWIGCKLATLMAKP
jgi:SAM-dependent methyltransferase